VSAIAAGGAEQRDNDSYRTRASMSYVSGGHHTKVGWDGGYYRQDQQNQMNDSRLFYRYQKPATNCATLAPLETYPCGNTSLQFPTDPYNLALRPVPLNVQYYTGQGTVKDRVWYGALYAQDQWTFQRFTFSGALRYDHAASRYLSTCIGGANEPYMPVQADGTKQYCTPDSDGVSYNDITPALGRRVGRVRHRPYVGEVEHGQVQQPGGDQRHLLQRQPGAPHGQHAAARMERPRRRPHRRLRPDELPNNGECGAFNGGSTDTARVRKRPARARSGGEPDRARHGAVRTHGIGVFPQVQAYCAASGDNLISGWGKRRYEWQIGIGVQHEILPRLSGEVTYNRRLYRNLTVQDQLGLGCDLYNGTIDHETCVNDMLNYSNPTYDFYTVKAPSDPRLPVAAATRSSATPTSGWRFRPPAQRYDADRVQRGDVRREPELLLARHRHQLHLARSVGAPRQRRHPERPYQPHICDSMVDAPAVRGRRDAPISRRLPRSGHRDARRHDLDDADQRARPPTWCRRWTCS
jgi:hypothetical protein